MVYFVRVEMTGAFAEIEMPEESDAYALTRTLVCGRNVLRVVIVAQRPDGAQTILIDTMGAGSLLGREGLVRSV